MKFNFLMVGLFGVLILKSPLVLAHPNEGEAIKDYTELVKKLASDFDITNLNQRLSYRVNNEGFDFVISRPAFALYRLERSAGNIQRAELIKSFLDSNNIYRDREAQFDGIIAKPGYMCKAQCFLVLNNLPLHSINEIGEVFAGINALRPDSSYSRTGVNSKSTLELLNKPFENRKLIINDFAKILSHFNSSLDYNANRSTLESSLNRHGFINGIIKPFLASHEIYTRNGEHKTVDKMNQLMTKYQIKNDFSIFSQSDLGSKNINGMGNDLSRRLDMIADTGSNSRNPTFTEIAKNLENHYINYKIESYTNSSIDKLAKEAKAAEGVWDASFLMGKIFTITAIEVGKTTLSAAGGIVGKSIDAYDYANLVDRDQRAPKIEEPTNTNQQPEKPKEQPVQLPKNQDPPSPPKEPNIKEPILKVPTVDKHVKGQNYVTQIIYNNEDPAMFNDPDWGLTLEEKKQKRIAENKCNLNKIINTGDPKIELHLFQNKEDDEYSAIRKKLKRDSLINPGDNKFTLDIFVKETEKEKAAKRKLQRDSITNPGHPGFIFDIEKQETAEELLVKRELEINNYKSGFINYEVPPLQDVTQVFIPDCRVPFLIYPF